MSLLTVASSSTLTWLWKLSLVLMVVGISGSFGRREKISSTTSSNNDDYKLRFNKEGEFKILQVSDLHYSNGKDTPCRDVLPHQLEGCSDLNTTAFLRRFIQAENPDLVVFTGDLIHGQDTKDYRKSMDEVLAPIIESNIPWAAVLGNWDVNLRIGLHRQEVMEYVATKKNTLSLLKPANLGENEDIYGSGNYNLEVAGVEGSPLQNKSVLNLYLLDSGDNNLEVIQYFGAYDWIHPSQQTWFTRTSKELQEAYMSEPEPQEGPAPGMVFFHIPLPEYKNITTSQMTGVKQEEVICSPVNSGFFDTMVKAGDIKAVFVGHGHINDYCGELNNIQLCYDAGFGYHGYGKPGWPRRARVINLKLEKTKEGTWGPVKSIETWKRLHDDRLTIIDPQVLWTSIGGHSKSMFNSVMSE